MRNCGGGETDTKKDNALLLCDGNLRSAFRLARVVDRLADDQPPTLEARMLASGDHIAFDAG